MLTHALLLAGITGQMRPLAPLAGTLIVTEGAVRVVRPGRKPETAGRYLRLRVGDRVIATNRPVATLRLDATRETWRLPERGTWEIQSRQIRKLDGSAPILINRGTLLRQGASKPPRLLAGAIRSGSFVLNPVGTVRSAPVEVSWSKTSGTRRTVVEVLSQQGERLWRTEPTASRISIPVSATEPGPWLQVRVQEFSGNLVTSNSTWLRVLPEEARAELGDAERAVRAEFEQDPFALGLALGDLWADASLISDLPKAINMMFPSEGAAARTPDVLRARPWQLGEWQERAGFFTLARVSYEAAWEAGERAPELRQAIERVGGAVDPSRLIPRP